MWRTMVSMLEVLISILIAGIVVSFIEHLYRQHRIGGETARKIVHITHGAYVATWPFFVSWRSIVYLEIAFFILVGLARWLKIFGSQRAIARLSWGEFFYPLGIILLIVTHQPRWIFVVAVLHLALADAFAALIGLQYGKNNSYKVFGQNKSVAGTATFFLTSMVLVGLAFVLASGYITHATMTALLLLPLCTTFIENVGVYGVDNLLIPIVTILLFRIST